MEGTEKDKVIIITGATGSMGVVATREMAREGWKVIMACRNLQKAEKTRRDILAQVPDARLELMQLDLSSQQSVSDFVRGLNGREIDAVFCNAGYMARRYELSVDGFEMDMATNYLGNKLLLDLLIPFMPDGGHIVNMVSLSTKFVSIHDDFLYEDPKKFSQLGTYARSKKALLQHSLLLAEEHPHLYINVADPGIVNSNMITMGRWYDPLADIFFRPFINSPEKGVLPALRALHSNVTGRYFVGKKIK